MLSMQCRQGGTVDWTPEIGALRGKDRVFFCSSLSLTDSVTRCHAAGAHAEHVRAGSRSYGPDDDDVWGDITGMKQRELL